jgi:type II secretory ATPase GspE/PulE/Tfp pilus assembly ATPase PilB-like protein
MSAQKRKHDAQNGNSNAPEVLEKLLQQAERAGASDIHLQMRGNKAEVAFRLDGVITPVSEFSSAESNFSPG